MPGPGVVLDETCCACYFTALERRAINDGPVLEVTQPSDDRKTHLPATNQPVECATNSAHSKYILPFIR